MVEASETTIMPVALVPHDLRRSGTEAKRDHNRKAKWAYGGRVATCRPDPNLVLPVTRPAKTHLHAKVARAARGEPSHIPASAAKIDLRHDVREALDAGPSDSSGVEDYDESAAAMYVADDSQEEDGTLNLFDVSGQMIFQDMVTKAVEKYETKETEKLVKEYEIISRESEMAIGYLADDDDFELVDRVHL